MMDKTLSVIIPTYNMERLLTKCIDSLIVNDDLLNSLDVLIINDGSSDNSSAVAHRYQCSYPDVIRVIDKDNNNYGSCINRGLEDAKGKYIKVLDADDYFDTEALEYLLYKLQKIDVDLVVTNYRTVRENGEKDKCINFDFGINTILPTAELGNQGRQMAMHAVTYKTENLRKINYMQTERISYTDQEWIFAPMTTVKSFIYIDICLYNYLVGRSGQTMDIKSLSKNIGHNLVVLGNIIKVFNSVEVKENIYQYLWERMSAFAEYIYALFLYNMKTIDVTPLIEFDNNMALECPKLYSHLSTIKAGKLPHILIWRKLHYKNDYGIHDFFRKRKYRIPWLRK